MAFIAAYLLCHSSAKSRSNMTCPPSFRVAKSPRSQKSRISPPRELKGSVIKIASFCVRAFIHSHASRNKALDKTPGDIENRKDPMMIPPRRMHAATGSTAPLYFLKLLQKNPHHALANAKIMTRRSDWENPSALLRSQT